MGGGIAKEWGGGRRGEEEDSLVILILKAWREC